MPPTTSSVTEVRQRPESWLAEGRPVVVR
jgi:hypothetical protein